MKTRLIFTIFTILFLSSRLYILANPPSNYSDVKQDYERYANTWWYGLEPYREIIFEYPPAAVPLLTLPLLLDKLGIGQFYINYRVQIFIFDCLLAIFVFKLISKLKTTLPSKYLSLAFFCLSPIIAKDFFYEGIDLIFSGLLAISLISTKIYDQSKLRHRISFWATYWWSFAVKFMSLPLFPVFFITKKLKFKKEVVAFILGFLLIWIIPLARYRSSISVAYVFHQGRTLKYSSLGDYIITGINLFTHSEARSNQPPDFSFIGPISNKVNQLFSFIFPISILLIIAWNLITPLFNKKIKTWPKLLLSLVFGEYKFNSQFDIYKFNVRATLLFCLTLILTGITISQPFAIWLIPLLTIFPYKNIKQQVIMFILTLVFIIQMTSPLHHILIPFKDSQIFISPFDWGYVKQTLRFIILLLLLISSFKLSYEKK